MTTNTDDNIIEALRTFSHQNDPDRVIDAEQALLPHGEDSVHVLTEALRDPDIDLRILSLQILEHFDGDTEPALPLMIKALEDPDRTVQIASLAPVARLGSRASDAVPILEKWVGGDDEFSHVSAVGHILMIDPSEADELLPVLIESFDSDDFGIRCQTAWLLGRLGEAAKGAVPELERMLDDEDSNVRRVASDAIQEITGEETDAMKSASKPDDAV